VAQQLSILAAIDVAAALKTGSLDGNYYLFDNNSFAGSTGQGTPQLVSQMVSSQVLNWAVFSIATLDPDLPWPFLTDIAGPAVEERIMVPSEYDSPDLFSEGRYWSGTIIPGKAGIFHYTMQIEFRYSSLTPGRRRKLPPPMTITAGLNVVATESGAATAHGKRLMAQMTSQGRP
jgi:hypothetical protein